MRNPLPLAACLALLFGAIVPALAQPRPVTQPISLGLPPEDPEKASIGATTATSPECHPLFASGIRQVGPPMAEVEKQSQGMVVAGFACDAGH